MIGENVKPITRYQNFLAAIASDPNAKTLKPITRKENILASAAGNPYAKNIEPISYDEYYLQKAVSEGGGVKNYKETIMTKAVSIPKVVEYSLGAGLAKGDYSVYVSIDTHLLPFGIEAVEGWLWGGEETLFLTMLTLPPSDDVTVDDATGYCVIWEGEWTAMAPDGTYVNTDAGLFEFGYGLMGGNILPLTVDIMAELDMRVDIYHHTMPQEA